MPRRLRRHFCWPGSGIWHHGYAPYCPLPPPWWGQRLSAKEEKESVEDYVDMLKEELQRAEEHLAEMKPE